MERGFGMVSGGMRVCLVGGPCKPCLKEGIEVLGGMEVCQVEGS